MWTAIWEFLVKIVDTIIQYLPDILKWRRIKKVIEKKNDTGAEVDKARVDVINGNVDSVNKRMDDYRKQKDIK